MGDEPQVEGSSEIATQESPVAAEVLDQWEALGEETTSGAPVENGSASAVTTATVVAEEVPGEAVGESPAEKPAEKAAAAPGAWTPSPQQLHALERAGMSLSDLAVLPDQGRGITEKLEKSWRDIGARWAQMGAAQPAQAAANPPAQAAPAAAAGAAQPGAQAIDFGFDPKVWGDEGAQALNGAMQKFAQPLMQRVEMIESQARQRENDALRTQVTRLFDGWAKDYDAYGDGKGNHKSLTPQQIDSRQKVLVLADRIVTGAALEGVTLPAEEALMQAHEAFTAQHRVEKQRQTIAAQVTNRKKQFVARPVSRNSASQLHNPAEKAADVWEEGLKAIGAA